MIKNHIIYNIYLDWSFDIERAEGSHLWTKNGKKLIEMLLRLTQQDDIATTTWINGTHHGVDPGVFHPESAVPSTKSGHAESTVKASSLISPLVGTPPISAGITLK